LRIAIDASRCEGHARCHALVPELFSVDDYGSSSVVGDGEVLRDLEERARLAIANCPEFAIIEVAQEEAGASDAS
jgi:ferredoxin